MKKPRKLSRLVLGLIMIAGMAVALRAAEKSEPICIGDSFTLKSEILKEERPVFIHVPPGYERSKERYPVLYVLDGADHWPYASTMADFFAENGLAPSHIVVGIPNTDRQRDLTPMKTADRPGSGGGAAFLKFLKEELFPYLEQNYRAQPYRILFGHSLAGMYAVHTLLTAPDTFQAYIAASPAVTFADGALVKNADALLSRSFIPNGFLYMTVGDEPEYIPTLKVFRKWLERKNIPGLRWELENLSKDTHASLTLKTMYSGLEKLYADWPLKQAVVRRGLSAIQAHYMTLRKTFGYEVRPSEAILNQAGYVLLLQEKNPAEAVEVFKYNVGFYPDSANVYDSLGDGLDAAGQTEEAQASYEKAVEKGAATSDRNLAVYKANLERISKKLAEKK